MSGNRHNVGSKVVLLVYGLSWLPRGVERFARKYTTKLPAGEKVKGVKVKGVSQQFLTESRRSLRVKSQLSTFPYISSPLRERE